MRSDLVSKWTGSLVSGMMVVFAAYLWFDATYLRHSEAAAMECKLVSAMEAQIKNQSMVFDKQMTILDQRQLDQLRTSRALLENELRRSPNDALLKQQLGIIETQIRQLEERLYKP